MGFHLSDDSLPHLFQPTLHGLLGQVDEPERTVDRLTIEEIELLLVPEHLQRRLAQHGEIKRGSLRGRKCKHNLVRKGRLAATRRARDQVERELGKPAAEDVIEPGNAGVQAINGDLVFHGLAIS